MRSFILASALLAWPLSASAHIHLATPQARTDSSTGDQKEQHCGVLGQVRTNRVTTYRPGEQIMVSWAETIDHPGFFRVAFQPNGDTFPIPAPAAGGGFPNVDQTGTTDAATGAIIIKDQIPDGMLMTQITLPNMECTNCTLQFIQVMTDKAPYTTDAASDDIYFNCADVTLSNSAPMVDAGVNTGPDAPGGTNPNPTTSGGCSTGGGAGLFAGLALVGLVTRRRARA